jgi:hypothetical protein
MSGFLYRELSSAMLGDLLGEGSARKVYVARLNDAYVIKIETKGGSFQNVSEWEVWDWCQKDNAIAKWLAPCQFISNCGSVLVQRRVEPLRVRELPARLPAFLCDLKRENFGMLDGRVVCNDYGTVLHSFRSVARHMVKAKWRA